MHASFHSKAERETELRFLNQYVGGVPEKGRRVMCRKDAGNVQEFAV
jgi:hypothetical protein